MKSRFGLQHHRRSKSQRDKEETWLIVMCLETIYNYDAPLVHIEILNHFVGDHRAAVPAPRIKMFS